MARRPPPDHEAGRDRAREAPARRRGNHPNVKCQMSGCLLRMVGVRDLRLQRRPEPAAAARRMAAGQRELARAGGADGCRVGALR